MLAQNFKSAADLGIEDAELDALIKVLGMLERGELKHAADPEVYKLPNGFNMADYDWRDTNACGTVCCIAGWCDRIAKTAFSDRHEIDLPQPLDDLFWGPPGNWNVTTEQAATALRSYLSTGAPNWAEAMEA